jgi:N utilization substance protein B
MSRHRSRQRAVQVLFQVDVRSISPAEAIHNYYDSLYSEENDDRPERDEFMEELVYGTVAAREELDGRISKYSENWRIERMPAVDRNILRLATFELAQGKLPPAVVIDEAVSIAKRFSADESVAFMNAVLDAIRREAEETK